MTWSLENSKNDESSKVRWELVPYFHGRVLDIGCGPYKAFPHFIGVDNGHHWGMIGADVKCEAQDLSLFSSQSCNVVYSSHLLEHIPYEDVPAVLTEWCRIVKQGGYVILYLPDEAQYPAVGHKNANPDHRWNVNHDKVLAAMEAQKRGWDLIDYQVRSETDEYSLFFVFKLTAGSAHTFSWKLPKPEKTCAVVRYGAIGDQIMTSSIFHGLKEQGYYITLYCQDNDGYQAIMHDPHIDRFIIQGKDEVPPQFLEEFWNYTRKKYTKWINLCESVESTLLASPGRANWEWPNELRARYLNRNYLEWTHDLAGVPPPYRPKFYSTQEERSWAKDKARSYGRRNILWSLSGSSGHKVWPHLDAVINLVLATYPDTHVVLVGDEFCRLLQTGWDGYADKNEKFIEKQMNPRVHCMAGKWTIRQSMSFAEVADLIIGTETGLLNAAGHMDVPKIVTLSHSSEEMLTKHWKNVIALNQPQGVGCGKHPCRQLHGASNHDPWEDCPKHEETGTALCQYHIGPELMWEAITSALGTERMVAYG